MFLFVLILYGTLSFLVLGECFLSQVREFFNHYVIKSAFCLFLFSFWGPSNVHISVLGVVPEVSINVLISFQCFFLLLFSISDFHYCSSLIHS